jgi:hypothetical protein
VKFESCLFPYGVLPSQFLPERFVGSPASAALRSFTVPQDRYGSTDEQLARNPLSDTKPLTEAHLKLAPGTAKSRAFVQLVLSGFNTGQDPLGYMKNASRCAND